MATLSILQTYHRLSSYFVGAEDVMDAVVPPLWLDDVDFEHPDLVARHLAAGGDAAQKLRDGATLLHRVVGRSAQGDAAVAAAASALLEHGADVDAADAQGWTALMVAADAGRAAVVAALAARGAAVDARNRAGGTALMVARYAGQDACASRLLDAGADAVLVDRAGHTADDWAALRPRPRRGRRHLAR